MKETTHNENRLYTFDEAAFLLRREASFIRTLARLGWIITAKTASGWLRIPEAEIERLLDHSVEDEIASRGGDR